MLLIDKLSQKPVYEQIVEGIERNILLGVFSPGSLLPSLRELSVTLGINPNTIQKAYAELTRRGIVCPSPGSGSYVAYDAKLRLAEEARRRLGELRELLSELRLAGIGKAEILATLCAVYPDGEDAPETPQEKEEPV